MFLLKFLSCSSINIEGGSIMNKRTYDKAIRMMQKGQYTLSELGIMPKDIIYIKNLENNVKMHYDPRKEDYVYYLAPYDDMAYIVISEASSEPETVKILEMSDIHHPNA